MKKNLMHPRLQAFFDSTLINGLMQGLLFTVVMLYANPIMNGTPSFDDRISYSDIFWGAVSLALLLVAVGYSVWYWWRKPKEISVSPLLSTLTGIGSLYFLIFIAFSNRISTPAAAFWWSLPAMLLCAASFIAVVLSKPEKAIL